jgi:hypothetical protein
MKYNFTKKAGITLIPIPFWWDKSSSSLLATIQKYRPDLNFGTLASSPIPTEQPTHLRRKFKYIPSAAKELSPTIDPSGG